MLSIHLTGASKVFLYICPNHINLFSRIFSEIGATVKLFLNSWFLIRSINVCPHIHQSIRIFVTFILCSKIFFTGENSIPYSKAGLIATRKNLFLTYWGPSYHITPRWLLATWADLHVLDDWHLCQSPNPFEWLISNIVLGCTFNNFSTNGHLRLTYVWCHTKILIRNVHDK